MKVFRFDPKTGRRGEQIDTRRRASWTDSRWNEYPYANPVGFGRDAEVTVHRNAGTGLIGDEISYRHATEWTCFCLGCWNCGPGTDTWTWVVLPPLTEEL